MDDRDAKALQGRPGPQWDVSHTAFNSAGVLRDLIRAVSHDDVQPQALLAAEALGLGLLVSPVRINEAIVALEGGESVKWEKFKVFIGLQAKGTIKSIRNSTALLQFFAVVTACKLCYTDSELGDVFFDIISESSVLSLFPVASSQLSRLISSLSGHCDRILPVDLMHDVAVAIDACSGNYAFYQRMENSALATLICKIFEHLRDETVESISLTGCQSGLWLATAFSWLLPDDTNILVDERLVRGTGLARLSITLTRADDEPTSFETRAWRLQSWKSEGDPTSFVIKAKDNYVERLSELPIKMAKSFFHHNYGLPITDMDGTNRRDAVALIGELAQALITCSTEHGVIFVKKRCCTDGGCAKVPIMNLLTEDWMACYPNIIGQYGWGNTSSPSNVQRSAINLLKQHFSQHDPQRTIKQNCVSFENLLHEWIVIQSKGWNSETNQADSFNMIEAATKITIHAIGSSLCHVESGNLKFSFSTGHLTDTERPFSSSDFIVNLLSKGGLDIENLRRAAFLSVFPHASLGLTDLALTQDGLVAAWGVMWNQTTRQRAVLQLKVMQGTIQREGFRYERIVEPYLEGSGSSDSSHKNTPVVLFHGESYMGLHQDRENALITTKYTSSTAGNTLQITTSLQCRDEKNREDKRTVSWISAITWLATATHIERPNAMSSIQEEAVARILHNKPLEAYWVSVCHNNVGGMTKEHNIILRSHGNEELRFWAAAVLAQRSGFSRQCISIAVRHGGPLISSLNMVAKSDQLWALIC